MNRTIERAMAAAIVLGGLAVAAAMVRNEVRRIHQVDLHPITATYLAQWREAVPLALPIVRPDAPIRIVVFQDIDCPFCRFLKMSIESTLVQYPEDVGVLMVYFSNNDMHVHRAEGAQAFGCVKKFGDRAAHALLTAVYDTAYR